MCGDEGVSYKGSKVIGKPNSGQDEDICQQTVSKYQGNYRLRALAFFEKPVNTGQHVSSLNIRRRKTGSRQIRRLCMSKLVRPSNTGTQGPALGFPLFPPRCSCHTDGGGGGGGG